MQRHNACALEGVASWAEQRKLEVNNASNLVHLGIFCLADPRHGRGKSSGELRLTQSSPSGLPESPTSGAHENALKEQSSFWKGLQIPPLYDDPQADASKLVA